MSQDFPKMDIMGNGIGLQVGAFISNDSLVGWHGHGENGTTLGSVNGGWEYEI